jgi:hypothetical protein
MTIDTPIIFNHEFISIEWLWKISFITGTYVKAICSKIIAPTPKKINLFEKNPTLKKDLVKDLQLNR